MRATLTDEHHLMLELIADRPVAAIPELARYTTLLAAQRLIELTNGAQWRVTELGEALLQRQAHRLH
jgi:hypothetical protein